MPSPLPLLGATRPATTVTALPAHEGARPTQPPPVAPARAAHPTELIERLRGSASGRPPVDPGLSGGLRAWLEDGASTAPGPGRVIVQPGPRGALTARVQAAPEAIGPQHPASGLHGGPVSAAALRAILLRTVLRLTLTAGAPRAPFEDALAAMAVSKEGDRIADGVQRLSRHRRAELREVVRHGAAAIADQWGPPPAAWLPRTGERLIVPLAGGRVVLRSDTDLVVGDPSAGRASVCVMRAHLGGTAEQGELRRFLMLLETVRSGAAPLRVASYDLDRGRLTVDNVTDAALASAVLDVLSLLGRHLGAAEVAR